MSEMGSNCSFGHPKHKLWQKKGLGINCQFDFQLEKIGNRPDLLGYRGRAIYSWKALDKNYNLA